MVTVRTPPTHPLREEPAPLALFIPMVRLVYTTVATPISARRTSTPRIHDLKCDGIVDITVRSVNTLHVMPFVSELFSFQSPE